MGIDVWNALAEATVSCPDETTGQQMRHALRDLGLADAERADIAAAIDRRSDPAGQLLGDLVRTATSAPVIPPVAQHSWGQADMDHAIETAAAVATDPARVDDPDAAAHWAILAALPPERAGELVLELVQRAVRAEDLTDRSTLLRAAVAVGQLASMARLPVSDVVVAATAADAGEREKLGVILGGVPRARLLRGLTTALRQAPDPSIAHLVSVIEIGEQNLSNHARERPPEPVGGERSSQPVYRGPAPVPVPGRLPEDASEAVDTADTSLPDAPARTAYPRIDLETGTTRHDVVVVDQPFTATVGLGPRPSVGIVSTGAIGTDAATIDVALIYDPVSLSPQGATQHTLTISDEQPHPTVAVTFTANYLPDGPPTRRIGVQYLVDGQIVGLAWRSFVAVDETSLVDGALTPPQRDRELLDLTPLLVEEAPDLVLAVFATDNAPDRWVWTAFATDPNVVVSDAPNDSRLDGAVVDFALETRRAIQFSSDRVQDYFTLAGRAKRIGASMPAMVRSALAELLTQPGRTTAPSVLLLTEELVIPWELAALDPPITTEWGGESPFLGAHVAIGRWPLTEHRPRPVPRSRVQVRDAAVVTADYTGVPGWGKLNYALAEADEVAAMFTPPAVRVEPELLSVIDLLRGSPPADILHVALHGQFDHAGDQEGIVLIHRDGETVAAQFLTPLQVENGDLAGGPFVFLNACQVGTDERVLGSYGGFSSTLLRIGAAGVVAPLWNIDDDVAADVARDFYAHTLGADQLPVAEAMRRTRMAYTESAVREENPGPSATLIAFQVFGHPRLRLDRAT